MKRLLVCIVLLSPSVVGAQVINEIYYSPSSKQWIEIYNNTDNPIDLTQYKVLDAGAAVNGHGVTAISGGSSLPPGEYAVIAKDTTSVSATHLFKSALSVKTTGDTVSLKTGTVIADLISFSDGSASSGESWQKFTNGWGSSVPTPGAENIVAANVDNTDATSTDSIISSQGKSGGTLVVTTPKFSVSIKTNFEKQIVLGDTAHFSAITNYPNVEFAWNWGDGSTSNLQETDHLYKYPGTYTVVLRGKYRKQETISRMKVKVVALNLSVKEVTASYVTVANSSGFEIDLAEWQLKTKDKVFDFPKDTFLSSGDKIIIPKDISGIAASSIKEVEILKREEVATTTPFIPIPNKRAELKAELKRQIALKEAGQKLAEIREAVAKLPYEPQVAGASVTGVPEASTVELEPASVAPENQPPSTTPTNHKNWITNFKKFFLGR